jgi:hypothetical protein
VGGGVLTGKKGQVARQWHDEQQGTVQQQLTCSVKLPPLQGACRTVGWHPTSCITHSTHSHTTTTDAT